MKMRRAATGLTFWQETFFTEKRKDDPGLAYEASRRFLNGLTIWKDRTRFVLPWRLVAFLTAILLSLMITNISVNRGKINWFNTVVEYNFCYPIILFSVLLVNYNQVIRDLSDQLDAWWYYRYLDRRTEELKVEAQEFLSTFYFYYYVFTVYGWISYGSLPLGRYLLSEQGDVTSMLLYQIWLPPSLHKIWIVFPIYIFELLILYILIFTFGSIAVYIITLVLLFGYQVRLMGIAFSTMEDRVRKMTEEDIVRSRRSREELYATLMQNEIRTCAKHYHHLYRHLQKACHIFSPVTNVLYYTGMCLMVYAGIALTNAGTNKFIIIQGVMLCASVIVNQYLATFVSVYMAEEASDLRNTLYSSGWFNMPLSCRKDIHIMQTMLYYTPKLRTLMGAECNMEFLSRVINTSYYYFSALYSMNIKLK